MRDTGAPKVKYNDLKKIPGHKNWYRNPVSEKITYKRGLTRIATGLTQITKAKEYVEAELAKRQGQVTTSAAKRVRRASNPLIKDVWDLLIEEKELESKPATMKTYRKNWRKAIEPFWGEKFVKDITDENLMAYKRWYLATHPTRQFRKTEIHFHLLIKTMVQKRILLQMPNLSTLETIEATTAKIARREKVGRRLKDEELKAIESAAATYNETPAGGIETEHKELLAARAQAGVALGARAGMRKMEALALPWVKVDFKNGVMHVWSTKNNKWREVPMVPQVRAALERQREFTGHTDWVFPMPSDPSRHISGQVFDKVWIRVKKTAEIVGRCRYHDLRHTFASMTADAGWGYKIACDVLDMSLEMYDRVYAHPSLEKKSELMHATFGRPLEQKDGAA